MPKFEVLDGQRDEAKFVCTFCAGTFLTRADLDDHWKKDKRCRKNRSVSNPTQSKYLDLTQGEFIPRPGAETLRLVREKEDKNERT